MGYQDRDEPADAQDPVPLSAAQVVLAAVVRLVGVAVLLVGLWAGIKIILEAWALYEDPQRIERFATAIQAGSNVDGIIGSLAGGGEGEAEGAAPVRKAGPGAVRLSYFAAWFVVLMLMFVIGSLAMAAITTGGHLALYDLQVRRHSRAVINEVRKLRRAA